MERQTKTTTRIFRPRAAIYFCLAGILFLSLGGIAPVEKNSVQPQAAPTPPAGKKTVFFKGKGLEPKSSEAKISQLPPPASLKPGEKRNLVIQALNENRVSLPVRTFTTFAALDPKTPIVIGKAWLEFSNPKNFYGLGNVYFDGSEYSEVATVVIKPQRAGQMFFIDCFVAPLNPLDTPFIVAGPDGAASVPIPTVTGHLTAVIVSENLSLQRLAIHRIRAPWVFYSCEVSTLD